MWRLVTVDLHYTDSFDFLRLLKISWHHLIVKIITSGKDLLISEF